MFQQVKGCQSSLTVIVAHRFCPAGIAGAEDSVLASNTASSKPGDLTVELPDGQPLRVIEVTVKPFNQTRVESSYASVLEYSTKSGFAVSEILVICREEDMHPNASRLTSTTKDTSASNSFLGSYEYKELTFNFTDIFSWIGNHLVMMPEKQRLAFIESLDDYINDLNTNIEVKKKWAKLWPQAAEPKN